MIKIYPLDIAYVKVSVNRKLFDPVRKISFKTSNNFPTIALRGNEEKEIRYIKNSILAWYNGGIPLPPSEHSISLFGIQKENKITWNR